MSDFNWCHGPECHKKHTVDRVRGVKGSKVLRTRKVKIYPGNRGWYSWFCSQSCYDNFANKYIDQVLAIAPRTEALETPIHNPEKTTTTTEWGYSYTNTKIEVDETRQIDQDNPINKKGYMTKQTDNRTEERKNRFNGQSYMLTKEEAIRHDRIFMNELGATLEDKELGYGSSKLWDKVRADLDWFRQHNAEAYMVLLDQPFLPRP